MGIETAIIIAAIAGTTAAVVSATNRPGSPDAPQIGLTEQEEADIASTTPAGRRATLLSGQPQGILTPGTTRRSALLGNV